MGSNSYHLFLGFTSGAIGASNQPASLFGLESQILILFLSFVLGPLLAGALNIVINIPGKESIIKKWILGRAVNALDFEKLVIRSLERELPILLTLTDGKFYGIHYQAFATRPRAEVAGSRAHPGDGHGDPFAHLHLNCLQQADNLGLHKTLAQMNPLHHHQVLSSFQHWIKLGPGPTTKPS